MPITLTTNSVHFKNNDGLYTAVDVVSDATTAERVAAVNAAGAAQVNAITEKGAEVINSIPQDYSEVLDALQNISDNQIIENTEAAAFVYIEDAAKAPIKGIDITIQPVQNMNGYDHPWPAGYGVNILDPNLKFSTQTVRGVTLTTTNGYTYKVTGTGESGSGNLSTNNIAVADAVVYPAGTYTAHGMIISTYHTDGTWFTNRSNTFTSDEDFIIRGGYKEIAVDTTYNQTDFIALVKGSTAPTAWTPYSNICSITGWNEVKVGRTGKNMLPKMTAGTYTERGVTITVDTNGVATFSGTATSTGNGPIVPLEEAFVIPKSGLKYCLNNAVANGAIAPTIEKVGGGGVTLSWTTAPANRQITLGTDKVGISCGRIRFYVSNNAVASGTYAPAFMVEAGEYVPNDGENSLQTIALPEGAGTVYGGMLHINEDGSGVLTVTHGLFTLTSAMASSLEHGYHATYGAWIRNLNYNAGISRTYYSASNSAGLCPCNFSTEVHLNNHSISSTQFRTSFNGSWTSYDEFAAAIAVLEEQNITPNYVALLETPLTYNLTAGQVTLLKGANTLYSDAGNISVDYAIDTKSYIDKKFAELQALILENV